MLMRHMHMGISMDIIAVIIIGALSLPPYSPGQVVGKAYHTIRQLVNPF